MTLARRPTLGAGGESGGLQREQRWTSQMPDAKTGSAGKVAARATTEKESRGQTWLQSTNAKLGDPVSWRTVRAWGIGSSVAKALASVLAGIVGLKVGHLYNLLNSQTTTQDQWIDAVQSKSNWQYLLLIVFVGTIFVISRRSRRTQQYVAKLPNAPALMGAKASDQGLQVPALWPPVPVGQPSWTRRIPWRLPAAIGFTWAIASIVADFTDQGLKVSLNKFTIVETLYMCAFALGIISAGFDLLRVRYLARWPIAADK
jgi:hypothetical protein